MVFLFFHSYSILEGDDVTKGRISRQMGKAILCKISAQVTNKKMEPGNVLEWKGVKMGSGGTRRCLSRMQLLNCKSCGLPHCRCTASHCRSDEKKPQKIRCLRAVYKEKLHHELSEKAVPSHCWHMYSDDKKNWIQKSAHKSQAAETDQSWGGK